MKKNNSTEKQLANIEGNLSKAEHFVEENSKTIFTIIGLIVFIFVAYFGYNNLYQKPLNEKAQKQLFITEQYFEKDSFLLALNGTKEVQGLLSIIEDYASTPSGNIAKYYAGICYLNIGDYANAINILDKYSSDDKLLMSIANMAIGDAFSEINQPKEAIEYYEKSIKFHKNTITTPVTLMKCGKIHESEKNFQEAINCYEMIKEKYPESDESKTIEKYISNLKYTENLN